MRKGKRGWIIPALIVIINLIVIIVRWKALPETLPAHFDPQGNPSGSMPRTSLLYLPPVSLALCMAVYGVAALLQKRFRPDGKGLRLKGLHAFTTCISLTVLSSAMVTLTYGKCPLFMFAEPVIMLTGIIILTVCLIKAHRS